MNRNYILTSDGYIETTRDIGWVRDGNIWKADYAEKLEWYENTETGFFEQKYKNHSLISS
jgi:hypothetical protein